MLPATFVPLSQTLSFWPSHIFGEPEFLNEIGVRDFKIKQSHDNLLVSGTVLWFREIGFDIVGLKGFSIVLLNENGHTAVPFEVNLTGGFALTLPNLTFTIRLASQLLRPVKLEKGKWVELLDAEGALKPAEIRLDGIGVTVIHTGDFKLLLPQGAPQLSLGTVQIGDSGVVVEIDGVRPYFSRKQKPPAGSPPGFRGFAITSAKLHLPSDLDVPLIPSDLTFSDMIIGTGGFSGKITGGWSPSFNAVAKEFTGNGAGRLFGIPFGLRSLSVEFKQNTPTEIDLKGDFLLPFFDHPVRVSIGIGLSGNLTVSLDSLDGKGLYKLTKPDVLEMELDSIGFELKDGVFVAKLSGQLTPLFGTDQGLNWPGFKVEELSIDSKGHVHLQGGWLALREQYNLDFHGFHVGITKLGFGKTEDGGKWVGFSGELKLVDGFTAGASVEGLRVTWYDDGRQTKISFNGIGVEFEIPDVLHFKGDVAYRELLVNGEEVRRFDGDIKLNLISLDLEIDAKLVVGSASGPQGSYNFFAIYLGVELPTGIPLSPTPLALYGMAGLFALQMAPDKREDEEWYEGWYKRPEIGITDLESKWVNRRGSMAFGVGATIGTSSDNGFTFSCKALLVILIPGKVFLLEGKANLLKERAKLSDDPMFRALAVLDMQQGQILIGLDAKYKQGEGGEVLNITAGAEAFFHSPGDWHIYMGEREPREKRIRARILNLFEANSYFMIDPKQLETGAWVGYAKRWKFGPVSLTLEAWLEGNVVVNWTPLHFHGDLWLHGNVEVNVFGFGFGLSVDARFAADVFDPFHVKASFEVSVRLRKPLKSKHFEITLEWGPVPKWPKELPLPLKEVAIEHFKVTTNWPLHKNGTPPLLLPKYDVNNEGLRPDNPSLTFSEPPHSAFPAVPLDGRPHLSFGRPVHDDALVGVNPQPVQPAYERIGNPKTDEGPVRVRYALKQIELFKRNPQTQQWEAIAAAGRPLKRGERKLYGSWAPVPQLPSGTGQAAANVKLWLWSKTPFDYTRHGGSGVDDWFIANFPDYPCVPQEIPDREVCCDFEKLDRSQYLETPWRSPEHPEITLSWAARARQRVTVLDPPVNGFTRALCFPIVPKAGIPSPSTGGKQTGVAAPAIIVGRPAPALAPGQTDIVRPVAAPGSVEPIPSNSVTIKLSAPAKRVKVWVVEAKKADKVCLNFRNRQRSDVKLPLNEQGVTIGAVGETKIMPATTTLGDLMGLNCLFAVFGPAMVHLNITLPCAATMVELMLSYVSLFLAVDTTLSIVAFNSRGEQVAAKPMLNPQRQPEIVRFEGQDLKHIIILAQRSQVFLHELCFLCPDTSPNVTATGFNLEGRPTRVFANQGNVVEVSGENLTQVQVNGKGEICLLKICALFGPDPTEVARRAEMNKHLKIEVAQWQQEGEVFEPFSDYRLTISTAIDAYGEGELSGSEKHLTQIEHAYFRTEGPPGLTKLSLPAGRDAKDADKFDSGLEDLTRYVRRTTPATIPAVGEKPVMAKPFYRAYDVGVEFNEDYVDLMYRISGRDLGLYLYDSNNLSVRDVEGRLLVQSGDWGAVEELTLTEGEQRWLALSNTTNRCLPVIKQESITHDKKLTSAIAGRVLEPDVIYEARLIPLLLREGFRNYATATVAQGPSGRLGRWVVRDEGNTNTPSKWEVGETVAPVSKYLTQTSKIKGGNDDASDPVKPGTMMLFGNDPALDSGHQEQPANWTDYRLSVYLRAAGDGAIGVVFRYRDGDNYYRLSMDRKGNYRRLVSVANGIHTILKQDKFAYEPQRDYLLTIEAIGDALGVYQDGALIFEVADAAHPQGSIGLYCYDNPGARFDDVRVDDFRQTAQAVYRYQFTTSLYANFFHHLHSYQDETWRAAVEKVPDARPAMAKAVNPTTPPTEDEARAYETLATTVLGQAARQNPPEVQVTRVEIDGAPLAFLVQSPEPIDWLRTELSLRRTDFTRTEPVLPGKVKLAAANFGANKTNLDSVVLLLREPMNLTGYRIESRLVTWPISPESGIVIDAQTLPQNEIPESVWATYSTFEAGSKLPAGTMLQIFPGVPATVSTTQAAPVQLVGRKAGDIDLPRRIFFSLEFRIVGPDGKIIHTRHFLPDDDYVSEDVEVLRKADGTGFFMVKPNSGSSDIPFPLGQYRLKLTYHRNNKTLVSTSPILSQAGNQADEVVTIDIPLQTQ
jgi:hypothetical protein